MGMLLNSRIFDSVEWRSEEIFNLLQCPIYKQTKHKCDTIKQKQRQHATLQIDVITNQSDNQQWEIKGTRHIAKKKKNNTIQKTNIMWNTDPIKKY